MKEEEIIRDIRNLVKRYHDVKYVSESFEPGETLIHYAGRVFDEKELQNAIDAVLEFQLTESRYTASFIKKFKHFTGSEYAIPTNSGSSANLLALTALTSHMLKDRKLNPGDEVITIAAGFPTTVNPILQNRLIPVFVDIEMGSYNIKINELKRAISRKTKAIFVAHTLGNPFAVDDVLECVKKHNLWLIEDCCDALGSEYDGRRVGSFGHLATYSFYPAHQITTGEGGMVTTNDEQISRIVSSFRDWGRDCYCPCGVSNTCGKRFAGKHGLLPMGYDHKYVYSHIGYNVKMTDMQAAIGDAQMDKLPEFIELRRRHFDMWHSGFRHHEDTFVLPCPTHKSRPAWFAYPVSIREGGAFSRTQLTRHLESHRIETRNLLAGNLLKQPAYCDIARRVVGDLTATDHVMNNTFFLGTYPGMDQKKIDYTLGVINDFLKGER